MQLNIEKKYSTTIKDNDITIYENSENFLQFNVMPNKNVSEKLIIKKYIVNSRKVEVYFDRKYQTDMLKSPDHFIFLSALVNLQKMIYVLMCKHFDIKYLPNEPEKFKIWPIKTDIDMNGMVRKKRNVCQDFKIVSLDKITDSKYILKGTSTSESIIKISGTALIYKI